MADTYETVNIEVLKLPFFNLGNRATEMGASYINDNIDFDIRAEETAPTNSTPRGSLLWFASFSITRLPESY